MKEKEKIIRFIAKSDLSDKKTFFFLAKKSAALRAKRTAGGGISGETLTKRILLHFEMKEKEGATD